MARRGLNRHRRGCRWRHAAACLLGAVLGGAASARSAPLEVYGRLPRIEEVALSPDGSRIAFVKTEENNRSEEHTSELQSPCNLVCRLLLEKKNKTYHTYVY